MDKMPEFVGKNKVFSFLLLSSVLFSLSSVFADTPDVYLSLTRIGGAKINIAIPEFSLQDGFLDRENLCQKSAEILIGDLNNSAFFKTVENRDSLRDTHAGDKKSGKINFKRWTSLGTEILVKGNLIFEGERVHIECMLYDVKREEQIDDYKFSDNRNRFRQIIHKLSDKITYRFTGEKGIAMTKLTFVSRTTEREKEIYISDYDGHNINKITDDKSITLFPKWSPDGKYILYTTFKYKNPDLYLTDIKGDKTWAISNSPGINAPATWSPDGKKLTASLSKDGNPEIYTMDLDGKNLLRLTTYSGIDTSPAWSTNGREIAFTSDRSGTPQIYIMGFDGTNLRRLTYQGSYNDHASWSPDGNKLAYSSRSSGQFDIFVINLVSSKVQQMTSGAGNNQNPTWSPDGRQIAFSSSREGKYQIYTMNADGTNQRRIFYLDGGGYSPSWSPRFE